MDDRYGRLILISSRRVDGRTMWLMQCDCGQQKEIRADGVRSGAVVSCGCFRLKQVAKAATSHGLSGIPEYWVWNTMIQRCENPNDAGYRLYGARGITVSPEWHDFATFILDMGRRPPEKTSIDRIDGTKGYEKGNCRWADWGTQNSNTTRNRHVMLGGERMVVSEACRRIGVGDSTIYRRAKKRNETLQQAIDHFADRQLMLGLGGAPAAGNA